jgi:hypothetical protein
VNGLLEKVVRDDRVFNIISVNVCFHCATKKQLDDFYNPAIFEIAQQLRGNEADFKSGRVAHQVYEKRREYLGRKKKKLLRDLNMLSITKENINKISFGKNLKGIDFYETVYDEFYRLLSPHTTTLTKGKSCNIVSFKQGCLKA